MNRRKRTGILINGSTELAEQLAKEIVDKYEVIMIEEPNPGLVMMKMRETSKRSLFYLGEVFVTECKVQINRCLGIGILKGNDPKLAHHLAVIDAAYNAGLIETFKWEEALLLQQQEINRKKQSFSSAVLKTKVNFETMDVQ
ncbi:phosphonate C-P lyase system protein PhnG [Peribacillus saganii]|uniref:Phosphonate C-P lyase system protein PhnG n=1 Tax=Peribacillus saganii TaxID=2303992 RepID=A0A372LN99_9BACI|nr:phosphonate C-P lyase system protein PhnG [Peribacillus saganii]RFU68994.1 phosphonate C-P lyase system protein PhnG [Peribacillus saganii]